MSNAQQCSQACPPTNVNDASTTKCFQCEKLVHLPCIGISLKITDISSPNIRIFCQKCVIEPATDLNASVQTTPKATKTTIKQIVQEMKIMRELIEANGTKLDSIDKKADDIVNRTESLATIATKPSFQPKSQMLNSTPKPLKSTSQPKKSAPTPSFANVLRKNAQHQSAKRQRTEENVRAKFNGDKPKAKIGTKQIAGPSGLSVVAKPKRPEKPSFTKAIWVSRLNPETTTEQIAEYIVKNTSITDKAKFNVHKLVKKDRELSTLKFVSFKIEANQEEFDVLSEPDIWPEDVMVREFLKDRTLGDFFPPLKRKDRSLSVELMEDETSTY